VQQVRTIVILNDYNYINGGIAQVAVTSANALSALGLRVIYFSAVENPAIPPALSPAVENYSTNHADLLGHANPIGAMRQGLWNKEAAVRLKHLLEKLDPSSTIIHLHSWTKALSSSIGRVVTRSGFTAIYTLHDYFIACPNGGFYNYQAGRICHLKPMSLSCICTNCDVRNYGHKLWRVARQAIQRSIGDLPAGIRYYFSVTKFSEDILRPYLPPDSEIFPLSSPVSFIPPGRPRNNASGNHMLYVGRISAEKGAALACEAARQINVPLIIAGEGPMKQYLQDKYPEVIFKGWLSTEKIFEEMLEARALLFPSVCYETQGLTVLEALSVGLPVIVSDDCAASEFVDTQNGFTFRSGDAADLASRIKAMTEDPAGAEEMSRHAYEKYWQAPYLLDRYIQETLTIYQQILEKDQRIKNRS